MSNPIRGMVAIISGYGVGKTTFVLECGYHPKEMIFINDDVKETGFEKEFKKYVDLVQVSSGLKVLDFHRHCLEMIDKLPKSKVIIWDTWTQFQATFPAYVKANPAEFRKPGEYSAMGKIKAGEQYQDAYRYEGAILGKLKSKCDLLILSFHLKQDYLNGVAVPGKYKPGHDRAIEKYADLRIWLTPNPASQVPIGLVMKNISKRHVTKGGIRTSQVLPLRLPVCNWESILEYYENPIADREPITDERPDPFELSLIEGTLTPEDKRMYEASLAYVEKQIADEQTEEIMIRQEQEKIIKEYIAANLDGQPGPIKVSSLQAAIETGELQYNGEVNLIKVNEWSK